MVKPPRQGYILDSGWYSGGGEAMYQLAADLSDMGYAIKIAYLDNMELYSPPDRFGRYIEKTSQVISIDKVVDSSSSFIIVPESYSSVLFRFNKIKPFIWWLSYNYYDGVFVPDYFGPKPFRRTKEIAKGMKFQYTSLNRKRRFGIKRYPLLSATNLSGSFFVTQQLEKMGIPSLELVHSIGYNFIESGMYTNPLKEIRTNNVLFNPAKPSRLMQQLIYRNNFNYVPIKGMNFDELKNLFRSSKLYVDFGSFPGPERLPKETVFNGVNILVGNRNAAATQDVPVPVKYKIDLRSKPADVEDLINQMLIDYSDNFHDFDKFRIYISQMQSEYLAQLNRIFG